MQSGQQEVCPSCGVVLPVHVARCPACGFLLAAAPGPVYQNSLPPRRPRPRRVVPSNVPTAVAVAGLAFAVVVVIFGFWWVRQRDDARAALPAPSSVVSAPPAASASAAPAALEPTQLYAKAKAAALTWHTDATLLSIEIAPVSAGRVDSRGKLTFTFGVPAGKKLGPGAPVRASGFIVTADAAGVREEEGSVGKSVAVGEPNCIFEDLRAQLEKAGIPPSEPLRFRYQMNDKSARGLWRITRLANGELVRTFDGANCAVIVHG